MQAAVRNSQLAGLLWHFQSLQTMRNGGALAALACGCKVKLCSCACCRCSVECSSTLCQHCKFGLMICAHFDCQHSCLNNIHTLHMLAKQLTPTCVILLCGLSQLSWIAITWLILPVVICLSQRLSHACLSISFNTAKLRMAH